MTKQELGTKRLCAHCGAKFYDLHHSPIICPKCETVFEVAPVSSRFASERAPAPEASETQFVSLGDGEAAESKDDEVEADDPGIIEEVEEDGAEVTDFIEDDEEHE